APADALLQANLTHAREQVISSGPGKPGWPAEEIWTPGLPYLSPGLLLGLCCGAYTLGWLGLVRWWMVRRGAPLAWGVLAFSLALVLAAGLAFEEWSARYESLHPLAVVVTDGTPLRKGNGVLYPTRLETPLRRGVEARLLLGRGDWL